MAISTQPSEDFLITQSLRNDWTRPIQYAPNCMSWKDSHPSKKQKQIMHDNDSYLRSKNELRKYDPSFHNKKYGKSGAGGQSSFNEVQKKCLWDVRDKAFHGKSFEKVQAEKVHIIDQNEYNNMHDSHKNPQHGYKPTNKIKGKSTDKDALIRQHINQNGGKVQFNKTTSSKIPEESKDLCIGKTNNKYKCPKTGCNGSQHARNGCMWCELPDMFLTPGGLAWTMLKQVGKHECK